MTRSNKRGAVSAGFGGQKGQHSSGENPDAGFLAILRNKKVQHRVSQRVSNWAVLKAFYARPHLKPPVVP